MFDIFYKGQKPNLFPHEQPALNLEDARAHSRTRFLWFIDGNHDYSDFDFDWFPHWSQEDQTHHFYCFSQHPGDVFYAVFAPTSGGEVSNFDDHPPQFLRRYPTRNNWSIPDDVDASRIDLSWAPPSANPPFIYHFGTDDIQSTGVTYSVPEADQISFVPLPTLEDESPLIPFDIFFVDMNNKTATSRFLALQEIHPSIEKIRFINGWVETIKRCASRSSTSKFWVISSENVYLSFDFGWRPESWQSYMIHVFGSQWQKWSDTFLISKGAFHTTAQWAKKLEEFPNLNFVSSQKVVRPDDNHDIYFVDHHNPESHSSLERLKARYPQIKTARYVDNYLDTLKRVVSTADTEYVWVINSVCDYTKFDFTWQPEPWQANMIHVFPSDDQKFGDTFYVPVHAFCKQMQGLEILEWFDTMHYCTDQIVPRFLMENVIYDEDSVVEVIKAHHYAGPFATFTHCSVSSQTVKFTPSLWRKMDRFVHVFTPSGSVIQAPRDAKTIKTQVYDYPYIADHKTSIKDQPLDIVYISNGEPDAQKWYDHLCRCAGNRTIHWVKDVPGRSAAYKAAANASTTPWFFAVFAKLEVNPNFEWDWQPDYLQAPKHYIFEAYNPVNGLIYGHMAVLAYNKNLVLATQEHGLDFTLSQAHAVVEGASISATAHFNATPEMTWRTAFRECIKLKADSAQISKVRLEIWQTVASGDYAEWSIRGANDAVEYFNAVNGDHDALMKSFEWEWLSQYFKQKHS